MHTFEVYAHLWSLKWSRIVLPSVDTRHGRDTNPRPTWTMKSTYNRSESACSGMLSSWASFSITSDPCIQVWSLAGQNNIRQGDELYLPTYLPRLVTTHPTMYTYSTFMQYMLDHHLFLSWIYFQQRVSKCRNTEFLSCAVGMARNKCIMMIFSFRLQLLSSALSPEYKK